MLERDVLAGHRSATPAAQSDLREFRFTQDDFRAIAALLREEAGISLPDGKAPLVYGRLVKRLRALGLSDFSKYVAFVASPGSREERGHMITSLTTNVTRFFREAHHFNHLRLHLTSLLDDSSGTRRMRIWSAACSTGQEPYSIAAVIADLIPKAARRDVKVLATDIDSVVLNHARRGRYGSIDGVPPELRRWFERDGNAWTVDPVLRGLVTFRTLNLNGRWPLKGPFDAAFCRNVAIYFDHSVQARLWSAFTTIVAPGGMLYIGHSERLAGPATAWFENVGLTAYRRRSAGR